MLHESKTWMLIPLRYDKGFNRDIGNLCPAKYVFCLNRGLLLRGTCLGLAIFQGFYKL